MFIPDPDFIYPGSIFLSIPDPNNNKRGGEKLDVLPFYVATNYLKFVLFLNNEQV
jgi:hypothetical protein